MSGGGVFTAWLASLGLISWHSVATYKRPPLPSEIAATVVVYGTLSLFTGEAAGPATLFGWALVVAGALKLLPGVANIPDPCASATSTQGTSAPAPKATAKPTTPAPTGKVQQT